MLTPPLIHFLVKLATRAYRRDEKSPWARFFWWYCRVLSSNCLDSKRNPCALMLFGPRNMHELTGLQRENITFGHDFDEDKYWRAVKDASLLPDLLVLPDGDLTEVLEFLS